MWELIDDQQITHFGTSPKYLGVSKQGRIFSQKNNHLNSLKAILSTGSPLPTGNLFSWIYDEVAYVPVMSIAGGTDLAGCFMGGNPNLPVYSEELQCKSLGMNTLAYDTDRGISRV